MKKLPENVLPEDLDIGLLEILRESMYPVWEVRYRVRIKS